MTRREKFKYNKSCIRCECCGKMVHKGSKLVLREHCADFLRQEGAQVNKEGFQLVAWTNPSRWLRSFIVVFVLLFSMQFVSSAGCLKAPNNICLDYAQSPYFIDVQAGEFITGSGVELPIMVPYINFTASSVYVGAFQDSEGNFLNYFAPSSYPLTQGSGSWSRLLDVDGAIGSSGIPYGVGVFYVYAKGTASSSTGYYPSQVFRVFVDFVDPTEQPDTAFFSIDKTSNMSVALLIGFFVLCIIVSYFSWTLGGLFFFVFGSILAFNRISLPIGVICAILGVLLVFNNRK